MQKNRLILFLFLNVIFLAGCDGLDDPNTVTSQDILSIAKSNNHILKSKAQQRKKLEIIEVIPVSEQDNNEDEVLLSAVEKELESVKNITADGKEESVPYLIEALQNEVSEIRLEAVIGLKDFTDRQKVVTELINMLDDTDDLVVFEAMEALSETDDEHVIDKFYALADNHSEEIVREIAFDYAELLSFQY